MHFASNVRHGSKQFTALHKNVNAVWFERRALYLPPRHNNRLSDVTGKRD